MIRCQLLIYSPTRMNLTLTKGRLKGAQTGHSLLAKKRDALMTRFRTILKKVDEAKLSMGRVLQLASFSLAEVTYTAGDIGYQVQESVRKASYTVQARQENVSGVVLPAFEGVRSKEASGEFDPLPVVQWLDTVPADPQLRWTCILTDSQIST